MKYLEEIKWEDIKVGEVFAWRSYLICNSLRIEIKTKKSGYHSGFILATEEAFFRNNYNGHWTKSALVYKLPKSTQRLFKEDYDE